MQFAAPQRSQRAFARSACQIQRGKSFPVVLTRATNDGKWNALAGAYQRQSVARPLQIRPSEQPEGRPLGGLPARTQQQQFLILPPRQLIAAGFPPTVVSGFRRKLRMLSTV